MLNSYQLYVVARKTVKPVPSPSPVPSPTPMPSPSPVPPRPSISTSPPKPIPSLPTPLNSYERENGIPLVQDSTVSNTIKSGETLLYQISLKSNQRLSISCSTLFGKDIELLIGRNFKPTSESFSLKMNSNHISSLDNQSPNTQIFFIQIDGPSIGYTQFILLPSITPLSVRSSSGNHFLEKDTSTGYIITIVLLSLLLIGTLIFFLGCCVYWRKTIHKRSQQESIGLIRPNQHQVDASYYTEEL